MSYSYEQLQQLSAFIHVYESWLTSHGYDLQKIKLITGLIYLNMSPLHSNKFNKMLWCKAIETIYDTVG